MKSDSQSVQITNNKKPITLIHYLSRSKVAGGSANTMRVAGRAAARAVMIISGSDMPRAHQSTPYRNVQPNE